ncbi:MAG TPA: SDR family NAD(P)-dependent oxidoreductase, partial [Methyloceanibacter sp.]
MTEPKPAVSPSLKGKVSLVTGSTRGIGLGIARALAGEGSDVVLNGFGKPEEIEAAREGVAKDYGVRVDYSPADMSKPDSIGAMIETTLREFGRLDVLVNNAGIHFARAIDEYADEEIDRLLSVN